MEYEADIFACLCILNRCCFSEKDIVKSMINSRAPTFLIMRFTFFISKVKALDRSFYDEIVYFINIDEGQNDYINELLENINA